LVTAELKQHIGTENKININKSAKLTLFNEKDQTKSVIIAWP